MTTSRFGLLLWAVSSALATYCDPTDAQAQFVDITQTAGIDFRYINGASGNKFMPEAGAREEA